jgi:hypothetical protein
MPLRWDHVNKAQVKAQRDISFEEIVLAIEAGGLFDVSQHRNRRRYERPSLNTTFRVSAS